MNIIDKSYKNKYLKYKNKYKIMKGGNQTYINQWRQVSFEIREIVKFYYNNINFSFLEEKMIRELKKGNAGGPVIRAHYPYDITEEELAKASIRGVIKLLSIKTIENAFNFEIKTFLSDRSLLTDLAWHSLMLKPQKYFMITNTILDKVKQILNDDIEFVVKSVNKNIDDETIPTPQKLVRHGTMTDTNFIANEDGEVDIIDIVNKIYYIDRENNDLEWNLPNPDLWTNLEIISR